jgi:hypothetical protein
MMPMPAGGPSRPAGYEFSEAENVTLASTAQYARWWGMISIVGGVLMVLGAGVVLLAFGAMQSLASGSAGMAGLPKGALMGALLASIGPLGIVYLVSGVLYLQSGNALQQVVDTQGDDMPLCMRAMQTLSRALMIEAIVTGLAFLVGVAFGIAGLGGKS